MTSDLGIDIAFVAWRKMTTSLTWMDASIRAWYDTSTSALGTGHILLLVQLLIAIDSTFSIQETFQ